ncbi:protein kinase family protein, partial [Genlisea aurea]
ILLALVLPSIPFLSLLVCLTLCFLRRRKSRRSPSDAESGGGGGGDGLIRFQGGEDLGVHDILEAPGEVIGKSGYGTLYRANLIRWNSVALLRFLRPTCTLSAKEAAPIVEMLGSVRHPNLVPLTAFYAGPRGEKLMVHPFYGAGNLAQFIRCERGEARKWRVISGISIGIAKGIRHLHTCIHNHPIIHGNLKSKNVMLDSQYKPYISDFGLHLVLNPTAGQQMLDSSAAHGCKPPELIKMKDVSPETDVYSLGLIFLELLTGKNPDRDSCAVPVVDDDGLLDLDVLVDGEEEEEDRIRRYLRLATACCSPARLSRPDIDQVVGKLEEIAK